jgi:hypothetical protein
MIAVVMRAVVVLISFMVVSVVLIAVPVLGPTDVVVA